MTYQENQIANGMKWDRLLKKFKALGIQKEFEWIESQEAIVKDIEAYNSSVGEVDVSFSSMSKTELKKEASKAGLTYDDNSTKDDLIVLLENKSDGV